MILARAVIAGIKTKDKKERKKTKQ